MNTSERKEKPILFSTSMVSAVLAGRKTQTRRTTGLKKINEDPDRYLVHKIENGVAVFWDGKKGERVSVKLPYGLPGCFLWVREKFCLGEIVCGDYVAPDPEPLYIEQGENQKNVIPYQYAIAQEIGIEDVKWKPSIFMFRKDSRIDLLQQKVRVERLNDISAYDALMEGIDLPVPPNCEIQEKPDGYDGWLKEKKNDHIESIARTTYMARCIDADNHVTAFKALWESINGPGSWALNPFVFVVDFEKVKP